MSSHRAGRVAEEIRGGLARIIREEVRDPSIGFVTITGVKLSSDLRHATVFVTAMPPERREDSVAGLNRAVPFLRRSLARSAGLRFTPQLRFVFDEAFESGQRVEHILSEYRDEYPSPDDASGDAESENGEA